MENVGERNKAGESVTEEKGKATGNGMRVDIYYI
jgi:hypothetical protein